MYFAEGIQAADLGFRRRFVAVLTVGHLKLTLPLLLPASSLLSSLYKTFIGQVSVRKRRMTRDFVVEESLDALIHSFGVDIRRLIVALSNIRWVLVRGRAGRSGRVAAASRRRLIALQGMLSDAVDSLSGHDFADYPLQHVVVGEVLRSES